MAQSEVICTKRLELVSFNESFLTEKYVAWLNDPEVVRYSDQRFRDHTIQSCRDYTESFNDSPHYLWAIVSKDDGLGHVGNICATVEPPHQIADLSILIGERRVWGQGIGREAWQAACGYLIGKASIRKITAGTLSVNHGMLRVMEKCGMVEEGRRLRQHLFEGREVDIVYSGVFASDLVPPAIAAPVPKFAANELWQG